MSALLKGLPSPVRLLDLRDFGFNQAALAVLKAPFDMLPPDDYLQKQNMFERIESLHAVNNQHRQQFAKFYNKQISEQSFHAYIAETFSPATLEIIKKIQPSRFRYFSAYTVKKTATGEILSSKMNDQQFVQVEAKTANDYDWRLMPRHFTELPIQYNTAELHLLIQSISSIIFDAYPTLTSMKLTAHHTKIISTSAQHASNSPEGIHQDGMDYIMSALVLIKENAAGGASYIYGADSKTAIFVSTLHEGQCIIQPDKNTDLWHAVDKITPIDPSKPAIRATIGFDFEFIS